MPPMSTFGHTMNYAGIMGIAIILALKQAFAEIAEAILTIAVTGSLSYLAYMLVNRNFI